MPCVANASSPTSSSDDLRAAALAFAASVRPEELSGADAATAVRHLATAEKAVATARMFLAVRVARSEAWRGQGHASAADWLAAQLGISVRQAQSQLATAKRAERLPKTKRAMEEGELSPDQADAVTDAASADPAAEEELLDSAKRDTNARLKERAAAAKAAATDGPTKEQRARAGRTRQLRTNPDGTYTLFVRGPAVDGVRFAALLRPHDEQIFRAHRRADEHATYENRCYDSLMALLGIGAPVGAADEVPAGGEHAPVDRGASRGADARGGRPTTGSPDAPTSSPGGARSEQRGAPPATGAPVPRGDNTKVIVRIDHSALARGHAVGGETCEVAGLGPVPVSTVQALLGDAFVAAVVTRGRDVVSVAHLGRRLNAHQRTALEWSGMRCSNVACNRTIAIEVDHRVPWAANPETDLANQDPLCSECHRRKTHHGWRLEPGRGPRRFLPPDVPSGDDAPPPDDVPASEAERVAGRPMGSTSGTARPPGSSQASAPNDEPSPSSAAPRSEQLLLVP
jgi:hypothetical protein